MRVAQNKGERLLSDSSDGLRGICALTDRHMNMS
jgi:hypothetical protein